MSVGVDAVETISAALGGAIDAGRFTAVATIPVALGVVLKLIATAIVLKHLDAAVGIGLEGGVLGFWITERRAGSKGR